MRTTMAVAAARKIATMTGIWASAGSEPTQLRRSFMVSLSLSALTTSVTRVKEGGSPGT
jgi:hypothetical protein